MFPELTLGECSFAESIFQRQKELISKPHDSLHYLYIQYWDRCEDEIHGKVNRKEMMLTI